MKMCGYNFLVENRYSEEKRGFYSIEEANNFINNEVEMLNKLCGEIAWDKEDFIIYKFDSEKYEWFEFSN